jgi:hypothetical protein
MSSSCVSFEKSVRADDTAIDCLLAPVVRRVVAALDDGNGVARRFPGSSGAVRKPVRTGGADDVDAAVNSSRSLLQTGQLVVLIALHVSHCPQTMPISCCSSRNVIPKGQSVLDVLDETGQATWQDRFVHRIQSRREKSVSGCTTSASLRL